MKNRIKGLLAVISIACAGYLAAAGMLVSESEEEALQASRYEKDGEVVYTSRTDLPHIGTDESTSSSYADNELIVQLSEGISEKEAKELAKENQAELAGFISITDTCQWRFDEKYSLEELEAYAGELTELPQVEAAYVNYLTEYECDVMPSNEGKEWNGQSSKIWGYRDIYTWGYRDIHADEVWSYVKDMKDPIHIGIMDGGFQRHDDLDYNIVRAGGDITLIRELQPEYYTASVETVRMELEHGTHVSGIAAATCDNEIGIAGVYPDPSGKGRIYGCAYRDRYGIEVTEVQNIADFVKMLLMNVKVLNYSVGEGSELTYTMFKLHGTDSYGGRKAAKLAERAKLWEDFLGRLIDGGHEFLLINSSGNASCHAKDTKNGLMYKYVEEDEEYVMVEAGGETAVVDPIYNSPWLYIDNEKVRDRIICVGAYDHNRKIASFSNMGDRVDIMAPGVNIYSTGNRTLVRRSGTSQAAPYVTGAAACIWSMDESLTASEVRTLLMQEMYIDQIRESITDPDINITKPVLNLANSMRQAKRYVEERREKTDERADEKEDEKEIPEESEAYAEKFMEYLEEELIPEYGIMSVEEIKRTPGIAVPDGTDVGMWLNSEDFQGILAVRISDYDEDGKDEMLLIRSTCQDMDMQELSSTKDQGGVRIYMEMYEYDGSAELAASRELIPCGKYRTTDNFVQTGFFTYRNEGSVYIGVDNHLNFNERITTLSLYQYQDHAFQYVKGFCRRRQGSCYEAVLTADSEPEQADDITFAPTFEGETNGWTTLEEYGGETVTDSELEENGRRLNELYYEQLKMYGLNSDDVRLNFGIQQMDARTADIYTSDSGDLSVVASIATLVNYQGLTAYYLYREDPGHSLDAYR